MTRQESEALARALARTRHTLTVAYTSKGLRAVALSAVDSATLAIARDLALQPSPSFNYARFCDAAGFNADNPTTYLPEKGK